MDNQKFVVTGHQLVNRMQEWLDSCDWDILAEFAGKIFGGECKFLEDESNLDEVYFDFIPTDDYMGAFNK